MHTFLLFTVILGCGDKATSASDSATNTTDPSAPVALQEGHWLYGQGELLSSTCLDPEDTSDDALLDEVGFTLVRISDEQFSIQPDGSVDEVLCTLQGQQFECEAVSSIETFTFDGEVGGFPVEMDVSLSIDTQSVGFVYDEIDMKFTFTVAFACYDVDNPLVDCEAVSQESGLPCKLQFSVAAQPD